MKVKKAKSKTASSKPQLTETEKQEHASRYGRPVKIF